MPISERRCDSAFLFQRRPDRYALPAHLLTEVQPCSMLLLRVECGPALRLRSAPIAPEASLAGPAAEASPALRSELGEGCPTRFVFVKVSFFFSSDLTNAMINKAPTDSGSDPVRFRD